MNAWEPDIPHENRINRIPTHELRSCTVNIYPAASVQSFEHVQNMPIDMIWQNGYHLTQNTFIPWGTDKKRMQRDTNGRIILMSVTRPLVLSGKEWQSLSVKTTVFFSGWLSYLCQNIWDWYYYGDLWIILFRLSSLPLLKSYEIVVLLNPSSWQILFLRRLLLGQMSLSRV